MEINSIIKSLLLRYPLFGNVIANLKFKYTESSVPAPAYTDGECIYYKQEFLNDYSDAEKEFIVAHEIFHIVLNHFFRNEGRDKDLLNYVEDAIINQLLVQDGLSMPDGVVNIPDALDYSTEELYLKYLPSLNEIKKFMNENTFHVELNALGEMLEQMYKGSPGDLINANNDLKSDLLQDFQQNLEKMASYANSALGREIPSGNLGTASPILSWQDILQAKLTSSSEKRTHFYEVEMDGIIHREETDNDSLTDSEIVIDSSGSMDIEKIKVILRECKNILSFSQIKVGFCDYQFYGWHNIESSNDIDDLTVIGGGGTNLEAMADSFTSDAENKIVITDGWGEFPHNRFDVLWIVMDRYLPFYCDGRSDINYIFINENEIKVDNHKLVLKKKR